MIQAVLADDEILARQKLRLLLRSEAEVEVVGESATGAETIELIRMAQPDLLFLDIRMPGMDGFDILEALSSEENVVLPRIVFTTAYDNYAIRAFMINAVDYLLKPFTSDRLHTAIERVRQQIQMPVQSSPANGKGDSSTTRYAKRIVFKSRGRILFLPVSDIRWIAAEENYVRLCTESERHLLRETMAHLEKKLDPEMFMRVHRSSIVNLQYIKEVRAEKDGELTVHLTNGQKISMSRGYRTRIQSMLQL